MNTEPNQDKDSTVLRHAQDRCTMDREWTDKDCIVHNCIGRWNIGGRIGDKGLHCPWTYRGQNMDL